MAVFVSGSELLRELVWCISPFRFARYIGESWLGIWQGSYALSARSGKWMVLAGNKQLAEWQLAGKLMGKGC